MRRAIFFEQNETKPRFVWAKIKRGEAGEEWIDNIEYFVRDLAMCSIGINPGRDRRLPDMIQLFHKEEFFEGMPSNGCIYDTLKNCKNWFHPIPLHEYM